MLERSAELPPGVRQTFPWQQNEPRPYKVSRPFASPSSTSSWSGGGRAAADRGLPRTPAASSLSQSGSSLEPSAQDEGDESPSEAADTLEAGALSEEEAADIRGALAEAASADEFAAEGTGPETWACDVGARGGLSQLSEEQVLAAAGAGPGEGSSPQERLAWRLHALAAGGRLAQAAAELAAEVAAAREHAGSHSVGGRLGDVELAMLLALAPFKRDLWQSAALKARLSVVWVEYTRCMSSRRTFAQRFAHMRSLAREFDSDETELLNIPQGPPRGQVNACVRSRGHRQVDRSGHARRAGGAGGGPASDCSLPAALAGQAAVAPAGSRAGR